MQGAVVVLETFSLDASVVIHLAEVGLAHSVILRIWSCGKPPDFLFRTMDILAKVMRRP